MERLRIAYVFDQALSESAADNEQVVNTVGALLRAGLEVVLVLPVSRDSDSATADEIRAQYCVDGNFRVEYFRMLFDVPRVLEKGIFALSSAFYRHYLRNFDLVMCRNISVACACMSAGVPVFYDTYRPWVKQYRALVPVFRWMFGNRHFLGMSLHSDYSRRSYLRFGFDESKIITAYNGYSRKHFEPVLSVAEARARIGVEVPGKLAVYAGRMEMSKGIDTILRVAEGVPECTFLLVGGRGQQDVEERVSRLDNVLTAGWQSYDCLPSYLYAADVLMSPTTSGPLRKVGNTVLPIKLFSYLAAGRAIFAPESPDTAELLTHGKNSYLVAADDPEAALSGFRALIGDDVLLERLSQGACETGRGLSWDTRGELLEGFISRRFSQYRDNN